MPCDWSKLDQRRLISGLLDSVILQEFILLLREAHLSASEAKRKIRIDEIPRFARYEHLLDAVQEVGIH